MGEKRSCLICELNCVCFAYISIEKTLNECEFINKEEDAADYPEEVVSCADNIYYTLAEACTNYIVADDEDEEDDFDEKILENIEKNDEEN